MTDAETLRRLALVKVLVATAESNATQAPPFNADSINRLHDALEMFLALAVTKHDQKIPKQFLGYWDELAEPLGRPLAFHARMERLNRARVALKHLGIEPSPTVIRESVDTARAFLTTETPPLFGIEWDDVSLTQFLGSQDARVALQSAEDNWSADDKVRAFADLREAFDAVLADYEADKKAPPWMSSIFDAAPRIPRIPARELRDLPTSTRRWQEGVEAALDALDYNIKLAGLGIDLRRFGRFKALTPAVTYTAGGGRAARVRSGFAPSLADFEFCRDFVISTALHLEEFAFSAPEAWSKPSGSFQIIRDGPRPVANQPL